MGVLGREYCETYQANGPDAVPHSAEGEEEKLNQIISRRPIVEQRGVIFLRSKATQEYQTKCEGLDEARFWPA